MPVCTGGTLAVYPLVYRQIHQYSPQHEGNLESGGRHGLCKILLCAAPLEQPDTTEIANRLLISPSMGLFSPQSENGGPSVGRTQAVFQQPANIPIIIFFNNLLGVDVNMTRSTPRVQTWPAYPGCCIHPGALVGFSR